MIKFVRDKSAQEIREDKFINSFAKTGFINENLFRTEDRDMWHALVRTLSSTNNLGVYKGILSGYRYLPYSEELSQSIIIKDGKNNKLGDKDRVTYATTEPQMVRYVECVFIYSPSFFAENKKGIEIANTLFKLKQMEKEGFTIFPHVIKFLENQQKIHFIDKNASSTTDDLFIRGGNPILQVPMLQDNGYYKIHGMIRFPYAGEYHYKNKTIYGQLEIQFLRRNRGKGSKVTVQKAYFDSAYTHNQDGEEVQIFYIRIGSRRYYLPFLFFDKNEIDEMMIEFLDMSILSPVVKDMLVDTYNIYIKYLESDTEGLGFNRIPTLKIWKENDDYYEKPEDKQTFANDDPNADKKDYIDFGANKNTISLDMLKSLILGYNDYIVMSFYPHMAFHLMNIHTTKPSYRGADTQSETQTISQSDAPRELMISKTIKSHPDLFKTFDNTNFIDVFHYLSYKMSLLETTDEKKMKKSTVSTNNDRYASKRYRNEFDYGLIDPYTIKSPENTGLQGNVSILDFYKDHFYFHDIKNKP